MPHSQLYVDRKVNFPFIAADKRSTHHCRMETLSTFKTRIDEAVRFVGLNSREALAARLRAGDNPKQTAGQWVSREAVPPKYGKPLAELGVSIDYINTGAGTIGLARPPSQAAGLDLDKLEAVLSLVEGAIRDSRKQVPLRVKANMIKRVYESPHALTNETAEAVRAALASILEAVGEQ